ncbi:hypothetical protein X566_13695 [Afipia sp. P52-10]|uniref:hypothetical protein n=1 Tax=Afipia sp. P52-10 TaxID=1429916 RepID=UPI0003DF317C|nr:hypothetical protein [Afipia sp. P52-10]ETR78596.1 hypothetical protein X566_13695 [Afipia sp. P52-10]
MRFKHTTLLLAGLVGSALLLGGPSIAEARGGHGHGHGHARGHHHMKVHKMHGTPPGWHRGRKVGWRGHHCPPGLRMQGRC